MGLSMNIKSVEDAIDKICVESKFPPSILRLIFQVKLDNLMRAEAQAYMHEMNETKEEKVEPPAVTEELQEVQDAGEQRKNSYCSIY